MKFPAASKDFLRFCAVERRHSVHTLEAYEFDLLDFRKWLPHQKSVQDVGQDDLKRYLQDMVATRNLSPATVRRRLACLRCFFRRLTEQGQAADPFGSWRPQLPRRKRLPRALVRSEIMALLHSFAASKLKANERDRSLHIALRLMVATGLRVGELCRLKLDDISPDCSVVRIHGKGSRDRVAYVTDLSLKDDVKQLVASRRQQPRSVSTLLINRLGATMKPQSVRTKLLRYAANAGIHRRVTPHMLRHTAATLLIETGVDIRFVQRLLGHSSIATTEIYTHVTDEALRSTLERANVLGSLALA
jgi:site-specific recombinase XerD